MKVGWHTKGEEAKKREAIRTRHERNDEGKATDMLFGDRWDRMEACAYAACESRPDEGEGPRGECERCIGDRGGGRGSPSVGEHPSRGRAGKRRVMMGRTSGCCSYDQGILEVAGPRRWAC